MLSQGSFATRTSLSSSLLPEKSSALAEQRPPVYCYIPGILPRAVLCNRERDSTCVLCKAERISGAVLENQSPVWGNLQSDYPVGQAQLSLLFK